MILEVVRTVSLSNLECVCSSFHYNLYQNPAGNAPTVFRYWTVTLLT